MVDRDTFGRRLAKLEELLVDLRELAATERAVFLADRGLQAQAERWLQTAAEACLDLAFHLIADRGWPTPGTYREAFRVLEQKGVLDHELAQNMEGWAALRNVLVHLYLDVEHERLWDVLTGELDQLEDFVRVVASAPRE